MALWVRLLALRARGSEFKSQLPCKNPSMAVHASDPSRGGKAEEEQQRRQVQVKTCLSKAGAEERKHPALTLVST